MKRKLLIVICILSILLNVFLVCLLIHIVPYQQPAKIIYWEEPNSIHYDSYKWAIEECTVDTTVSPIIDYKDAAEKGQQLWETILQGYGNPKNDAPINPGRYVEVFRVPDDDAWVICGTSPDYGDPQPSWTGILPITVIKNDGTVLSVGWI